MQSWGICFSDIAPKTPQIRMLVLNELMQQTRTVILFEHNYQFASSVRVTNSLIQTEIQLLAKKTLKTELLEEWVRVAERQVLRETLYAVIPT